MATKLEVVESKQPDPKQAYNPSDALKEHERRVYQQYYTIKPGRAKYETIWKKARKTWDMERPERGMDDWQSNIIVPTTTSVIEAIMAEMIDLNLRPYVVPVGGEDKDKAKIMNHIINYTWERGNCDLVMFDVIKDALTLGTGVAQEYYLDDRRTVHQLSKFDPAKGIEEYITKEVSDYNDVILEPIKLDDILVDPKKQGFNGPFSARYAYRRYVMHIEEFRRFFSGPIWNPFNNAQYVKPGGDTSFTSIFVTPTDIDNSKDVEVLWYWEKSPDDALIICANGIVIVAGPNPYKHKQLPFARAVDIKRTHEFYGKGEVEMLESLQEEITLLRRMRLDQTHLAIFKPFLVSERESLDESELLIRPGGPIHVNDPELGIKELEISDPPRSSYLEEDRIKEDVVRVTGVDDRFQSVKKATTATEAAILKESTLKHVRMKLWLLQRTFLSEVGRLRIANIQQFYSVPTLEKVLGDANTQKYQETLATLEAANKLQMVKGQPYEKKYRQIQTRGETVIPDLKTGTVTTQKSKGFSFFEATPDLLDGNYDVQFLSSPDIPISKPLQLSKLNESLNNPVVMLAVQGGYYDAGKLADELLELNDIDVEDIHTQQQQQQQDFTQQLVDLAQIEDQKLENGDEVPPTPFSSPGHTEIHMAYLKSLPNPDPKIVQAFTDHIMGELTAQAHRQDAGVTPGQPAQGQPGQPAPATPNAGPMPAGVGANPMANMTVKGQNAVIPGKSSGYGPTVRAVSVNPPPGK